jgi:hypothetical protein
LRGIAFDHNAGIDILKNEIREMLLIEKSFQLLSEILAEVNDDAAMIKLE